MQLGAGKSVKTKDLYDTLQYVKRDKVDFAPALAAQIPQNRDLALKEGNLSLAVENLLVLEKQTRQAGEAAATCEVCVAILSLCKEAGQWSALNSNISLLVKRRGQLKQVVTKIVQVGASYLDETPNLETKLELIHTLRAVSEGKIHTELERARLTRILAEIKEKKEGNVAEAAEILQEVQVETYGSMEREEKVDYILEQIRLCLDKGDLIRATIISKKINTKQFDGGKLSDLKLRYYQLLNRIHFKNDAYLPIATSFQAIYNTPSVQEDPEKWKPALRDEVIFLAMAPFDNEQSDMMARVAQDKRLDEIPEWKNLLHFFRSRELVRWPLVSSVYVPLLSALPAFQGEDKEKRFKNLHKRVTEYNIRVISKSYSRLRMARLANLLDLSLDEAEAAVSEMVSEKQVYARIDRLDGICSFAQKKEANEVLNEWARDIGELLTKVEKACHLIHKEQMLHQKNKAAA